MSNTKKNNNNVLLLIIAISISVIGFVYLNSYKDNRIREYEEEIHLRHKEIDSLYFVISEYKKEVDTILLQIENSKKNTKLIKETRYEKVNNIKFYILFCYFYRS